MFNVKNFYVSDIWGVGKQLSKLYEKNGFVSHLASEFGQQCVVASMDIKSTPDGSYQAWSESGNKSLEGSATKWIEQVVQDEVGELYLNSMDRDGTGQGYDLGLLDLLPVNMSKPVILVGGVGNATPGICNRCRNNERDELILGETKRHRPTRPERDNAEISFHLA